MTIFRTNNLSVSFSTLDGPVHAVKNVNISVAANETIAIVGESGSGKSQSMMAAMGLLAKNGRATGEALYRDTNLLTLSKRELNTIRGARITMIFQEPMTSLDPLYTIGDQLAEIIRKHRGLGTAAARKRALELLNLVRIPDAGRRIDSYPHEMSGGQRQRVMIAMAIANDPDLIIADEPTTALDVTTQAEILDLLASLQQRLGMGLIFITHDLGIVRRMAQRVYVMRAGEVVEEGDVAALFSTPKHAYTRSLIDAEPHGSKAPPEPDAPVVLEGRDIQVGFRLEHKLFQPAKILKAVDHVSLGLKRGQTIGIVGESGSGKSTLARAFLRLVPSEGHISLFGQEISGLDSAQMRPLRRDLQVVFQDPFGSLSPRMTAGQIVTEGLRVHEPGLGSSERDQRASRAFAEVGLEPALRNRYPHEFSGGQRQRIAIARAIILKPKVIILDEPTSALDRNVQKQILDLLRHLQNEHNLAYLFISHDLKVVRAMADLILVMKDGEVVETGTPDAVFGAPKMAYTQRLMRAALGERGVNSEEVR